MYGSLHGSSVGNRASSCVPFRQLEETVSWSDNRFFALCIEVCNEDGWNKLRQKMGMVFQYSALFDFLTVGENVAFGLRQHTDKSESEIQGIVDEMLELVGLPQSKEQYPAELSGGMKKRVGLARAIANRPEIVLYDEPTAGLDPIMSNNISRLIRKTQQQLQVTSVLVTHDMESAFYAADRIAMLYKGKIVALGTVEEIRNGHNQIVDKAGLDSSAKQELALKNYGVKRLLLPLAGTKVEDIWKKRVA